MNDEHTYFIGNDNRGQKIVFDVTSVWGHGNEPTADYIVQMLQMLTLEYTYSGRTEVHPAGWRDTT